MKDRPFILCQKCTSLHNCIVPPNNRPSQFSNWFFFNMQDKVVIEHFQMNECVLEAVKHDMKTSLKPSRLQTGEWKAEIKAKFKTDIFKWQLSVFAHQLPGLFPDIPDGCPDKSPSNSGDCRVTRSDIARQLTPRRHLVPNGRSPDHSSLTRGQHHQVEAASVALRHYRVFLTILLPGSDTGQLCHSFINVNNFCNMQAAKIMIYLDNVLNCVMKWAHGFAFCHMVMETVLPPHKYGWIGVYMGLQNQMEP